MIGLEAIGIAIVFCALLYGLGLVITVGLVSGISIVLLAQVIKTR